MSDVVSLLVLVALLLGNAFFVAAEIALVSVRADQLEPRAQTAKAGGSTPPRDPDTRSPSSKLQISALSRADVETSAHTAVAPHVPPTDCHRLVVLRRAVLEATSPSRRSCSRSSLGGGERACCTVADIRTCTGRERPSSFEPSRAQSIDR